MKLIDLSPRSTLGGISFNCPCCLNTPRNTRLAVRFSSAAPHVEDHINFQDKIWQLVSGSSFNDLTLQPSIDASKYEHWHGFITNGEIS